MSIDSTVEKPQANLFIAHPNFGAPFLASNVPMDTFVSADVVSIPATVLKVFGMSGGAKIGKPVVVSDAVYVVHMIGWPRPCHVQPSKRGAPYGAFR